MNQKHLRRRLAELGVAPDEMHFYDLGQLVDLATRGSAPAQTVAKTLSEAYGLAPTELASYELDERTGSLRAKEQPAQPRRSAASRFKGQHAAQETQEANAYAQEVERHRGQQSKTLMGPNAVRRGQRPVAGRGTRPMPPAQYAVPGAGQNPPGIGHDGGADESEAPGWYFEGESGDDAGHTTSRMPTDFPDKPGDTDRDLADFHGIEGTPDAPITHGPHGRYAEHEHAGDSSHEDAELLDEIDDAASSASGPLDAYSEMSETWTPPQPGTAEYDEEIEARAQELARARYGHTTQLSELPWEKAQRLFEDAQRSLAEEE